MQRKMFYVCVHVLCILPEPLLSYGVGGGYSKSSFVKLFVQRNLLGLWTLSFSWLESEQDDVIYFSEPQWLIICTWRHLYTQQFNLYEVCASQLGIDELRNRMHGWLGVGRMVFSDYFLLTCGGIESVAWHPKSAGYRCSAQTRWLQVQINSPHLHPHTPTNPIATCSWWYDLERLKNDFNPAPLPPVLDAAQTTLHRKGLTKGLLHQMLLMVITFCRWDLLGQ